jgi:hypothetical protein
MLKRVAGSLAVAVVLLVAVPASTAADPRVSAPAPSATPISTPSSPRHAETPNPGTALLSPQSQTHSRPPVIPLPAPPTQSQLHPRLARYLRANYATPQYGGVRDAQVWALSKLGQRQFACLWSIAQGESRWNPYDRNPRGGAYGIPQAFPASRMASAGSDWATNPLTQVRWMVAYVKHRYGSACAARTFRKAHGWY